MRKIGSNLLRHLLCVFLFCACMQCMVHRSMALDWSEQDVQPSQTVALPEEKNSSQHTGKPPLVIRDIKVELEKDAKERVLVYSTRFFTPSVFALEGDRPRFVIDIPSTGSVREGIKTIPVGGRFIKRIRTRYEGKSGTFRIVLDLRQEENYTVNQTFFEAENIYVIDVEQDRKTIHR